MKIKGFEGVLATPWNLEVAVGKIDGSGVFIRAF